MSETQETANRIDFCSAGNLLRALLVVHGLLGVIAAVHLPDGMPMHSLVLLLSWVEPSLLLWLAVICMSQRMWRRYGTAGVLVGGALLGAACAALVRTLAQPLMEMVDPGRTLSVWQVALVAAVLAALFIRDLQLRSRAFTPMDVQARLTELQARIRPHFLFNALNAASALVREQPERAEAVLDDLAALFRASVGKPGALVTLDQEIDLARRYLDIEAVRFAHRMQVRWDVDERLLDIHLPALTLQPLVENAVRHGVERSREPVAIDIGVARRLGQIEIEVRNDLPAMDAPAAPTAGGTGTALRNIRQRLHLLYDLGADVDQGEVTENGRARWRVRLRLPL